MDEMTINYSDVDNVEPVIFRNRMGYYENPPFQAVIATFDELFCGPSNVEYHLYSDIRSDPLEDRRHPV